MPAVVLGGSTNALSVARSLWSANVPVDLLADGRGESVARHSRACRRYVTPAGGDGDALAEEWMSWLERESEPSVLLPCSDEGVEFIARRRAALEAAGHRPIEGDDEASLTMLDKAGSYELARKAEIPAPQTLTIADVAQLADIDFDFPCGIKPLHSHRFAQRFNTAAKGVTVATLEDARRILEPILEAGFVMLLTEVIPGADDRYRSYYTYMDAHGQPVLNFTKRKLRQYPTHFGLGSYHLTEWNEETAELGIRFAQAAGLRGVVNVEFKRDPRDGLLKLIECNPRFTEVNEQVRAAGIDLALVAYNMRLGLPLPPVDRFTDHLGMWFPVDDLRALREYRGKGELTVAAWARTLGHRQAPVMFSWRDPKPSMLVGRRRLSAVARRLGRMLSRRDGSPPPVVRDAYDVAE
jgi:predicted ATP-grasp superfamily ATP-dependent carboligase